VTPDHEHGLEALGRARRSVIQDLESYMQDLLGEPPEVPGAER
jgi:hypothetical protein